jgi:hypothetical protein
MRCWSIWHERMAAKRSPSSKSVVTPCFSFGSTNRLYPLGKGFLVLLNIFSRSSSFRRLEDLCTTTLQTLRTATRSVEDFIRVALEASQSGIIDECHFRRWFSTYINRRHDELLEVILDNDDAKKLCSILISALALATDDASRSNPSTPSNGPSNLSSLNSRKRKSNWRHSPPARAVSDSYLTSKDSFGSDVAHRNLKARVEDGSSSE